MRLSITTDRLTLRRPEERDADALARSIGDFDVARMTSMAPHPYPVEAVAGWITFAAIAVRRRKAYHFLIDVRGEGVRGGISLFHRTPGADWEVGYHLARPAWGRGIATEALAAMVGWSRDDLGAPRVIAGYFEDNPASRRVLEKAGFAPTGTARPLYSLARKARVRCIDMALEHDALERSA